MSTRILPWRHALLIAPLVLAACAGACRAEAGSLARDAAAFDDAGACTAMPAAHAGQPGLTALQASRAGGKRGGAGNACGLNAANALPAFDLTLSCGEADAPDPFRLSAPERQALADFVAFVEEHQDRVVYVGVRIQQACAACGCPRTQARDDGDAGDISDDRDDGFAGTLAIDTGDADTRRDGFAGDGWGGARMFLEGVLLEADVPGWAVVHEIFLPRWRHLDNPQYRAGEYGTFARFDGLFVARFHGRTGVNMLHLDVLDPSERQLAQLDALRRQRAAAQARDDTE
ncbi:hypothetical protein [Luteimonas mephitis]|uniref:hypothetical protein n=1 Tax=Luteimonas mephitis TaxID=83615 RepID=UPI0012EC217A|nr:hypothetical protein [Luteimonas mephitis]